MNWRGIKRRLKRNPALLDMNYRLCRAPRRRWRALCGFFPKWQRLCGFVLH